MAIQVEMVMPEDNGHNLQEHSVSFNGGVVKSISVAKLFCSYRQKF